MKISILTITAFFVILAALLGNTLANADIPMRHDLNAACFPYMKPTGEITLSKSTLKVICEHNKSGELVVQAVRL